MEKNIFDIYRLEDHEGKEITISELIDNYLSDPETCFKEGWDEMKDSDSRNNENEKDTPSRTIDQTGKSITRKEIWNIRERIKRESYHWYKTMREGNYEYVHEFRERISEIMSLQKKHHEIIDSNEHNPQIQQTSLAELHRLSITLSNLFDVAPTIINGTIAVPTTSETKTVSTGTNEFIV